MTEDREDEILKQLRDLQRTIGGIARSADRIALALEQIAGPRATNDGSV